ncbi:MAG: hypothetical protein K2G03_05570 [Bacilli bacterium]|nr:hypothetical protein [Bacilli bacterium]
MKKIRLMIFLTLSLFSFGIATPKVFAYNATVSYGRGVDIGIRYSQFGNASSNTYKQRDYTVTYGGKTYEGYCLDPDLNGPKNVTCSPYDADPGMIWLLQQLVGKSKELKLLAFRMYGVYKDLTKNSDGSNKKLTPVKEAIIRFLQVKDGNQEVMNAYSSDPYAYLFGNTALIDEAFNLAYQARSMSNGLDETAGGSINVGQKQVNGLSATYPLTSAAEIKPEYIDFECENCTIMNKQWNGTTGTITVTPTECDKDFKFYIVYKSSETSAYMCSNGQKNSQTIYMIDENAGEVKVPYPDKITCDGPEPECCKENPIEPGWIGGNVNNCCEDGGNSEAHEYDLDQLFCYDKDLHVDYYNPKCKTDYYVQEDTGLNEKYCKMFCTERVSVEIPGPITATSGRYFQLTTTSKGTKSPYIEGFKRCRIRVQYDIWEDDYGKAVDNQVKNYNLYQKNEAWRQTYQDAVDKKRTGQTSQGAVTLKFSASCSQSKGESSLGAGDSCSAKVDKSTTKSATVKYTYYPFSKFLDWYNVELDADKRKNYQAYEIKRSFLVDRTKAKYSDNWSAYNFDYSDLESKKSEIVGKTESDSDGRCSCTATWKFDGYELSNAEKHSENVEGTLASYTNATSSAMNAYNSAVTVAKQLEEDIDRCDNYFTKYEGADAERNYSFNASMDFSYTQVYMDNEKGLQMDEQYIQFEEEPGCVITGPTPGPDGADKLAGKRYSTDYSKSGNIEQLTDFGKPLQFDNLQKGTSGYKAYLDAKYDADKLFTHDAKYRAECSWNEGENVYYTLSPNGFVSDATDFINFTEHGQEYRLHLSTLDGTYETHWKLIGLGSADKNSGKGKFDDFFMSQGETCANESPSESSMLTCKIHVEYEIVLTGYCNGSNGTDTTVNVEDCDPYKEGYNLFSFKVVDSTNLFPNGYSTDAGEVGYNWSSTEKGQAAKREIEARGAADKTYSQENLTYSFILSPTDMGHVKNYNAQANADGGYSDFNMNCSCSGSSCVNCKSIFLNELANGNVTYDGQSHSVTGWGNKNTSLDGIRRKYGW